MSADLVATVTLGILARNIGGNPGNKNSNPSDSLQLFWPPFLILQLGGPDTVTAYSLEDNELWPRHLLGLLVQTGIAFYVFVKSWVDTRLKLIAMPVFIAGIIKYGERTWVLRTLSTKCISNSLLSDPDPGPDYAEVIRKKKLDANFKLSRRKVLPQRYLGSLDDFLSQAYYLFSLLKYLFADLILGYYAFLLLILSDWTKLWLVNYLKQVRIGKRWSRAMFKYNLIKFCLRKQATMWIRFQKILGIEEIVEKLLNVDCQDVDAELQKLIFQQLKERSENINSLFDVNSCKKLLRYRAHCLELLKWSTIEVEFDHSLLLWHIATQLCYYADVKRIEATNCLESLNISQCLSDYMLYLLVTYPNILSKGIGEIRY